MKGDRLYLAQSDTTIGFLSQSAEKISEVKNRPKDKKYIITISNLKLLKEFVRVNRRFKKRVRRAKKTTFIYKERAVRVVKDDKHLDFLSKIGWAYSSSANLSFHSYDKEFAFKNAEIVVEDNRGLKEGKSSKIYKIGKTKLKIVR